MKTNNTEVVKPYNVEESKKEQVARMFDSISGKYDFLNHFLSMGIDVSWRKKAVQMLAARFPQIIIDMATGTGDFAIEAAALKPQKIIGVDISEGMLAVGRQKINKKNLAQLIDLRKGDSESMAFEDNYADAVTIGFGARNFENLNQGLSEIYRVLKPGGQLVILEPAIPQKPPMSWLFKLYFKGILPLLGRLVSKDKAAYTYLPKSVEAFPNGKEFVQICEKQGFKNGKWIPLTFGICSLYWFEK